MCFLQWVLWPVELAVSLAEEPNSQTKISLFFNVRHSESLHVSACSLLFTVYCLFPWTPFRYITGLVGLEQSWWNHLPLQVIHQSYLVKIKSETSQNDIHLEKYTKKTLCVMKYKSEFQYFQIRIQLFLLFLLLCRRWSWDFTVWILVCKWTLLSGCFRYLFCLFILEVPVKNVLSWASSPEDLH